MSLNQAVKRNMVNDARDLLDEEALDIIGSDIGEIVDRLEDHEAPSAEQAEILKRLRDRGASIRSRMIRNREGQRRKELEEQLALIESEIDDLETEIAWRNETKEVVDKIIDKLRDASLQIVKSQLQKIEPPGAIHF